jgi:hypothetical protein
MLPEKVGWPFEAELMRFQVSTSSQEMMTSALQHTETWQPTPWFCWDQAFVEIPEAQWLEY